MMKKMKKKKNKLKNVVVGLQASREYPVKVLSEKEKRIWSVVSWPSSMEDVLQRSCEMEKINTKLIVYAFRAAQSMLPLILTLRIVLIDEGSPTWKPDDLPKESLITLPIEFIIFEMVQQVIIDLNEPSQ